MIITNDAQDEPRFGVVTITIIQFAMSGTTGKLDREVSQSFLCFP
jgi:hypothetical protein